MEDFVHQHSANKEGELQSSIAKFVWPVVLLPNHHQYEYSTSLRLLVYPCYITPIMYKNTRHERFSMFPNIHDDQVNGMTHWTRVATDYHRTPATSRESFYRDTISITGNY
ncbi:hypothetical protein KIN20_034548 [Parelaphostrongylus tenuis]|uniref:Uncharacterized protein n=1 Tax=Parelaphostrongylus tenuis TaxID=148309 RepID=A0AAD5RAI3_PARTN|nr:hypothetical protein KIN20_034548 [Parelaphostrongylus tenuis]